MCALETSLCGFLATLHSLPEHLCARLEQLYALPVSLYALGEHLYSLLALLCALEEHLYALFSAGYSFDLRLNTLLGPGNKLLAGSNTLLAAGSNVLPVAVDLLSTPVGVGMRPFRLSKRHYATLPQSVPYRGLKVHGYQRIVATRRIGVEWPLMQWRSKYLRADRKDASLSLQCPAREARRP